MEELATYVHGIENQQFGSRPGVFEVAINFRQVPPVVHRALRIAIEGDILRADGRNIEVGHVGTGACNALGEYVTTIDPAEGSGTIDVANSPGVYVYRPSGAGNGSWSRIIGFGDPVPGDNSFYGGDFGDVALDDNENLLLAAATTQTPAARVSGFAGSQALIATSVNATRTGRVVLQTGDMLPFGSAAIQSVGLVDLAANRAFAAQVTAKLLDPAATRPGTALIVGNTQAAIGQQVNSQVVLQSRNTVDGRDPSGPLTISEILFGQHSTQLDAFGRLVFTAEFLMNPNGPQDRSNTRCSKAPHTHRRYFSTSLPGNRVSSLPIMIGGYIAPITASRTTSDFTAPTGTKSP